MIELLGVQPVLPKFGPGQLPEDYLPINDRTLKAKDDFGPLPFRVSSSSNQHHSNYINQCVLDSVDGDREYLYPFEFWSTVRVMSRWKFGRLNDLISLQADRLVSRTPKVGEELVGKASVQSVRKRGGLSFGFFQSTTRTERGELCIRANDVLLLISGCDAVALKKAVAQACEEKIAARIDSRASILAEWSLRMRFQWPEGLWHNNVHTHNYAVSLGYERALVEGPPIVDVVWHVDQRYRSITRPCHLSWKYLGPLHVGTPVVLVRSVLTSSLRRYQICEAAIEYPSNCRVLLDMEVKDL